MMTVFIGIIFSITILWMVAIGFINSYLEKEADEALIPVEYVVYTRIDREQRLFMVDIKVDNSFRPVSKEHLAKTLSRMLAEQLLAGGVIKIEECPIPDFVGLNPKLSRYTASIEVLTPLQQ